MNNNRLFNHCLICAFIFVTGLGFALVLPYFAHSQGLAYEFKADKKNLPTADRYYVAKSGDGTSGLDWTKAFTDVQDALGVAKSGNEIWVATGVYTPGIDETDSFNLVPGVAMYGGFDTSETQLSDRNWENNVTVLSGDIGGDDNSNLDGVVSDTEDILGNNSYHVVWADGTTGKPITNKTILDGFTITAGKADNTSTFFPHHSGGGFYCNGNGVGNKCNPSLSNIKFSGNFAYFSGGAMYNSGENTGISNPELNNVVFSGNFADTGGAMYNKSSDNGDSSLKLKNVTFSDNSARSAGGAMVTTCRSGSCNPILTDVAFISNTADAGGAILNYDSSMLLTNVIFSGNFAIQGGGAFSMRDNVENNPSRPILTNVIFSGNSATGNGGAMLTEGFCGGTSIPLLINVTFSGNKAGNRGGAMYNFIEEPPALSCEPSTNNPEIQNSILWNNQDTSGKGTIGANIYNLTATVSVSYSLVEASGGSGPGWVGGDYIDGGGNIDDNPMFVTPLDPSSAPTKSGNLRLLDVSPAINAGNNDFVTEVTDLAGNPRIRAAIVDMGAYEYQIDVVNLPLVFR